MHHREQDLVPVSATSKESNCKSPTQYLLQLNEQPSASPFVPSSERRRHVRVVEISQSFASACCVLPVHPSSTSCSLMSLTLAKYESFLVKNVSTISTLESSLRSITWFLPGRFKDADLASEACQSYISANVSCVTRYTLLQYLPC